MRMKKSRLYILTDKEREDIFSIKVSKRDLIKNFTFSKEEILHVNSITKGYLKLGYSLQFLYIKNLGFSLPSLYNQVPIEIINYISEQLDVPKNIQEYWKTEITKRRHLKEITTILGFSKFKIDSNIIHVAEQLAFNSVSNHELTKNFLDKLRELKILRPSFSTIEELLFQTKKDMTEKIYTMIFSQIEEPQKLDILLENEYNGESLFSNLKHTTVNISPKGVKELLSKVKMINSFNCVCDLSFLSDKKLSFFNNEIQKSNKFRIQKFSSENKKYAYLAMFLHFKRKIFIDMIIEVTSNYAHTVMKRSKKKNQTYNTKNLQNYKENSEKLKNIVANILEINDFQTFKKYKDSLLGLKIELDSQQEDLEEIDFLLKSHQSFNYTNELLECIEFDTNTKPDFIEYLNFFKKNKHKKKLETNISFLNSQWQKNIKKYDFSKKVIEIALLYTIRDYIRSGDIFVRESKKYNSFDHYLIETAENISEKEIVQFVSNLRDMIKIPSVISFEHEIEQDERSVFSNKIYNYFPKITMAEIVYEVNSWTRLLEDFRINTENQSEKQKTIVATLLANGHNIGFSKMAISSSIDESVLRRSNEYYFTHETLSKIQRTLVNYHHSLDVTKNWGNGETSSSDGMRVPISSKTIYADYNRHYNNRGGIIYRHINDQYIPYYVQMSEGRDSNHVLDGLLYHGTDLDIYEHSTDTAGYTEQMFALTYLLGFEFKPRIKNADQQQLYAFENIEIDNIKIKKVNEKIIVENYQEILRLVESIRCEKVKASLILQKISSYARDNSVAKGLKEIGRLIKTKYLLEYFSDKQLRKEVQQILNKGEAINALGRIIYFGKSGRLNESTIDEQSEKASSLNILLGILIIWNSRYLEKVYKTVKDKDWFNLEEFKRVSPLGSRHVNFLGKYIFEEKKIITKDGLRPLEI